MFMALITWALDQNEQLPLWIIFAVAALLILEIAFSKGTRLTACIFLFLSLYATAAYVALVTLGLQYAPHPSGEIVRHGTAVSLVAVCIAYVALEALPGHARMQNRLVSAARESGRRVSHVGGIPKWISMTILAAVSLHDHLALLRLGASAVIGSNRRSLADEFWLASNHNVQVLGMVATIVILGTGPASRRRLRARMIAIGVVLLAWVPYLMVGSRKELLAVAASVALMRFATGDMMRPKAWAAGGAVAVAILFSLPAVRAGSLEFSLHEFILPQYMLFTDMSGLTPPDFATDFLGRSQFLLPSALRSDEVTDLGAEFAEMRITTVGVGSSPFAEANFLDVKGPTWLVSSVLSYGFFVALHILGRLRPEILVAGFGLMLMWGRSDFWISGFFAVFIGIGLAVVCKLNIDGTRSV